MVPLLLLSIFAASLNSIMLHKLPKDSDVFLFNLIGAVIWFCILFSINGFKLELTGSTIFWGLLYGIVQMAFLVFKTKAMNTGPVSVTTLIGNCSLILSTIVGVVIWNEKVSIWQILGIFFLIIAFFFCTYTKSTNKISKSWVFYCVFFFVFAASVGIVFKMFSKMGKCKPNDMMTVAAIVLSILFFCKKIVDHIKLKHSAIEKKGICINKTFFLLALISGILSCLYNRLNVSLAGKFDSAIFYPCFNGGVILLSLILSFVVLKERISKNQIFGLTLGSVAVLIIGFCN